MGNKQESESGFNFYCYGEVATDKPEDTNIIEVFPKDIMYNLTGEINNIKEDVVINRTSADGKIKTNKISTGSTIPARWLGLSSTNRVSAPDVRKGETVMIFRYGTNDDYYWEDITTELSKRGKETVTYLFKNSDSQDAIKEDGSNAYYLTYSTRHKFIHLHTSSNDGEPVSFDFKFNTKDGIFELKDSRNNFIMLNSPKDYLKTNVAKQIDLVTKVYNIITEEINIVATKKMTINTPTMDVKAGAYTQTSTGYTLTTSNYSVNSASGTMEASSGGGYVFSNKITATDLKTSVVASINSHGHRGDSGGTTGGPISI